PCVLAGVRAGGGSDGVLLARPWSGWGTPDTNGEVIPSSVFCETADFPADESAGALGVASRTGMPGMAMVARRGLPGAGPTDDGAVGCRDAGSDTRSAPQAPQKESVGLLGDPQLEQREGSVIASDTLANWRAPVRPGACIPYAIHHAHVQLGRVRGTMADS